MKPICYSCKVFCFNISFRISLASWRRTKVRFNGFDGDVVVIIVVVVVRRISFIQKCQFFRLSTTPGNEIWTKTRAYRHRRRCHQRKKRKLVRRSDQRMERSTDHNLYNRLFMIKRDWIKVDLSGFGYISLKDPPSPIAQVLPWPCSIQIFPPYALPVLFRTFPFSYFSLLFLYFSWI